MRVAIIEDEKPAARSLERTLRAADPSLVVAAILGSVASALAWLRTHPEPDLIFMDIALTDGLSFAIFDQHPLACPVIFTTAFDEYWQEAFEHNGIDYLLKPIRPEKLTATLAKYDTLRRHFTPPVGLATLAGLATPAGLVAPPAAGATPFRRRHLLRLQLCLPENRGNRILLRHPQTSLPGRRPRTPLHFG